MIKNITNIIIKLFWLIDKKKAWVSRLSFYYLRMLLVGMKFCKLVALFANSYLHSCDAIINFDQTLKIADSLLFPDGYAG